MENKNIPIFYWKPAGKPPILRPCAVALAFDEKSATAYDALAFRGEGKNCFEALERYCQSLSFICERAIENGLRGQPEDSAIVQLFLYPPKEINASLS